MQAPVNPLPIIRPITDLRTSMNEVCAQAAQAQEPVVLTKNGVASFVLMDCDTYERSLQSNRAYLALREAELEEQYHPESVSEAASNARMREVFGLWGMKYAPEGGAA